MSDEVGEDEGSTTQEVPDENSIVCPVCGEAAEREKCKVICRSNVCRGRVIYNCAEF